MSKPSGVSTWLVALLWLACSSVVAHAISFNLKFSAPSISYTKALSQKRLFQEVSLGKDFEYQQDFCLYNKREQRLVIFYDDSNFTASDDNYNEVPFSLALSHRDLLEPINLKPNIAYHYPKSITDSFDCHEGGGYNMSFKALFSAEDFQGMPSGFYYRQLNVVVFDH